MTEKLKQAINEGMVKLPKETQEVLNTFDWGKVSEEIGKKYSLNESQINNLQLEIGLVLIGVEAHNFLEFNIQENVRIREDITIKILEEVNEKIFKAMFDKLEEIIKRDLKNKVINWQQNLDFILSGGNYSCFIKRTTATNTQQQIPEEKMVFNPSRVDDLKNKFTI